MQFLVTINLGALYWFQTAHPRPGWLNQLMLAVTRLGDNQVVVGAALAGAMVALYYRQGRLAVLLLLIAGVGFGLTYLSKNLVKSPRPDVAFLLVPTPRPGSFPSGHASLALTAFGTIALALSNRIPRRSWQAVILVVTGIVNLAVGYSRLYLGVHYVSDVLGGWCLGGSLCLLFLWLDWRWACLDSAAASAALASHAPVLSDHVP
jgi:undecaprenyl-diphosphatase